MMTEIMRQTQDPRHVTTAHLCGRFADLAIECGCLFDDHDTRFEAFALQHERGRRAGKRAPDDHDVVIEIHRRSQIGRGTRETQSVGIRLAFYVQPGQSGARTPARGGQAVRTPKAFRNETAVASNFTGSAWTDMRLRIAFKNQDAPPVVMIERLVFRSEHWAR